MTCWLSTLSPSPTLEMLRFNISIRYLSTQHRRDYIPETQTLQYL